MHFSFSVVNKNADENEIPFSAEKRKRKSPVPLSQKLVTVQLRTLTFSAQRKMTFLKRKRKIKQK